MLWHLSFAKSNFGRHLQIDIVNMSKTTDVHRQSSPFSVLQQKWT
ncbi:unnamed protein product [Acidithrix sp. C25]|nr:unnamed protein product [Acidithrix sp. C25]